MPYNGEMQSQNCRGNFGLCSNIDPNGSINDLPGKTFFALRDQLDTNPADKDWRALARVVENEYKIKYVDIIVITRSRILTV